MINIKNLKVESTSETRIKKIRCLQSAFNSIEQRYDAEKLKISEQIIKEKENWLVYNQKLSQEEYNFLCDFWFTDTKPTIDAKEKFLVQFPQVLEKLSDALCSEEFDETKYKLGERVLKAFS